jgi:hypothetical protein
LLRRRREVDNRQKRAIITFNIDSESVDRDEYRLGKVAERRDHRLKVPLTRPLGKPPGSGSLKSCAESVPSAREYGPPGRPVIASRVCGKVHGESCRKLGWNHVGDPRAPRAWGFCILGKEVVEMTESETGTAARCDQLTIRSRSSRVREERQSLRMRRLRKIGP